jgi:hypothetical protein
VDLLPITRIIVNDALLGRRLRAGWVFQFWRRKGGQKLRSAKLPPSQSTFCTDPQSGDEVRGYVLDFTLLSRERKKEYQRMYQHELGHMIRNGA